MRRFVPVLRENDEMLYQLKQPYRFDGSNTANALGLQATPYETGLAR